MKRWLRIEWLAVAAAACILAYLLLVKPLIGMADSGDFLRIAGTVGLQGLDPGASFEDRFFGYFHSQYQYVNSGIGGYISTQIIVVFIAVLINKIIDPQLFDIRFLAVLYSILLLTALFMLLRLKLLSSLAAKVALGVIFLIVFLDVGYSAYFNSLFGEPISLVFFMLTVTFALKMLESKDRTRWLVGFFIAAVFLTGSKVQNAPVGLILSILMLRCMKLSDSRSWKKTVAGLAAVLLLVSAAIYVSAPQELRGINQYQSVFFGILKGSPHPEKDLKDLGINPELAVLAGTNYFTPNTPIPQQSDTLKKEFYSKISHGKIAMFYLTHPGRYIEKLQVTANNSLYMRPSYLGNYEKSAGFERGKIAETYSAWSKFKSISLPHKLWFILLVYALYYWILIASYRRTAGKERKRALDIFMSIGLIGIVGYIVPLLGDGEADMEKHLFLFNLCFDAMFTVSAVWFVHQIVKRLKSRAT